jgi:hypothetical protein
MFPSEYVEVSLEETDELIPDWGLKIMAYF